MFQSGSFSGFLRIMQSTKCHARGFHS
jgi:hypothetical protein